MDSQITQSEVRLNRALEQRGQMDQQMLEKFQFVGSKCRSRILVFTYASVEPSSFRQLFETTKKFTTFLRRLPATEVDSK